MTSLYKTEKTEKIRKAAKPVHQQEVDAFDVIAGQRCDELSFVKLKLCECRHGEGCRECRKERRRQLVKAYDASVKEIQKLHAGLQTVIRAVIETFVWVGKADHQRNLYQQKLQQELGNLPPMDLEIADALIAEVMVKDEDGIRLVFHEALQETMARLLMSFKSVLVQFQHQHVVGSIQWLSEDVCKYDFFRTHRDERKTGESFRDHEEQEIRASLVGRTWTTYKVTTRVNHFSTSDTVEHHEHQLFNAARHQYPARMVSRPAFVSALLAKIPTWIQPHVFIVEGDMIRETIEESECEVGQRETTEEASREYINSGHLMSPAVVLGGFVLTGWSGRDM